MANPVFRYDNPEWDRESAVASGLPTQPDFNWYFWTETWCDAIGPYESEQTADLACAAYAAAL